MARDLVRPESPEPLPHPVVDNHCHLDMTLDGCEELGPAEALARAAEVGVPRIVQIGCELESARWSVRLAEQLEGVVAGVSLHPNEAPRQAQAGRPEREEWAGLVEREVAAGAARSEAIKTVARQAGVAKREVYDVVLGKHAGAQTPGGEPGAGGDGGA